MWGVSWSWSSRDIIGMCWSAPTIIDAPLMLSSTNPISTLNATGGVTTHMLVLRHHTQLLLRQQYPWLTTSPVLLFPIHYCYDVQGCQRSWLLSSRHRSSRRRHQSYRDYLSVQRSTPTTLVSLRWPIEWKAKTYTCQRMDSLHLTILFTLNYIMRD